jgi:hypothetical protein
MTERLLTPCWSTDDARALLVTEALSGDDSLFLATHTPVRNFEVGGSEASDMAEATEEALIQALSQVDRRHAFCVIQGEPGSGKSHLIRWLAVNWPHEADLCILIQRANGSLEGALRQLQTSLPAEFSPLFDKLGQRQAAGLTGRAMNFLLTLGGALQHDHFTKPPPDADWCREYDPSTLILNTAVRQSWTAPRRILELMDGAGERNSESASFNLQDILDLSRLVANVHDNLASERLARRLIKEAERITAARGEGKSWDDIKIQAEGGIQTSLSLIDALNARRNYAVQNVIGVSADGLKSLFEELRVALRRGGRRLVLLLEDITSWEGLDDSLIDVLVTDAGTREDDLCPLISVVGVTPEYYNKLPANYRQRITQNLQLGQTTGLLQDVAALRGSEDRTGFFARYLSAARAGVASLSEWRQALRADRSLVPPNPCGHCGRVEVCHKVFGEVDGVGLFPFTHTALERLFNALKEDAGGTTHRTPRGIIQGILSPTLRDTRTMQAGTYPGPQIENEWLTRPSLDRALTTRLNQSVSDPTERERLRRLYSYWGDGRAATTDGPDGEILYGGLSKRLVTAFGLPWIADADADAMPGDYDQSPNNARAFEPEPSKEAEPQPQTLGGGQPQERRPRSTRPTTPAIGPQRVSRSELERLRGEIEALREGRTLVNSNSWNLLLFELVGRLDPRRLGIDRWTFSKMFTPNLVKIEGTVTRRSYHFIVGRSDWLIDGLEAYAELKDANADLSDEQLEFSRRKVAVLLRRLESVARVHVTDKLPRTSEGALWSPVTAVIQTLLVRAWLQGAVSADTPPHEQWQSVLSESTGAETAPMSRTRAWQDALSATKDWHGKFRTTLLEMVKLPQGGSQAFTFADAREGAAAIVGLCSSLAFRAMASSGPPMDYDDLQEIRTVTARVAGLAPHIPAAELTLIEERSARLLALLRGRNLRDHFLRLDAVITQVSDTLPGKAAIEVRDWKSAFDRATALRDDYDATKGLEILLSDFDLKDSDHPAAGPALLSWLADRPVGNLNSLLDLAKIGESAVQALIPHVRDIIRDAAGGVDLGALREKGERLRGAAGAARQALADGGGR